MLWKNFIKPTELFDIQSLKAKRKRKVIWEPEAPRVISLDTSYEELLKEINFEDLLNEASRQKKGKRSAKDILSMGEDKDKFSRTRFNTM